MITTFIKQVLGIEIPMWLILVIAGVVGFAIYTDKVEIDHLKTTVSEQVKSISGKDKEIGQLTTSNEVLNKSVLSLKTSISNQNDAVRNLQLAGEKSKAEFQKRLLASEKLLLARDLELNKLNDEANTTFENTCSGSMTWLKQRSSSLLAW